MQTWPSSKTTLSAEHERVFLAPQVVHEQLWEKSFWTILDPPVTLANPAVAHARCTTHCFLFSNWSKLRVPGPVGHVHRRTHFCIRDSACDWSPTCPLWVPCDAIGSAVVSDRQLGSLYVACCVVVCVVLVTLCYVGVIGALCRRFVAVDLRLFGCDAGQCTWISHSCMQSAPLVDANGALKGVGNVEIACTYSTFFLRSRRSRCH